MNRTFALAATLAAGVAMAPMAADAATQPATITFGGFSGGTIGFDTTKNNGALTGVDLNLNTIIGLFTLFNPNIQGTCNTCTLDFITGGIVSFSQQSIPSQTESVYVWEGGGDLEIKGGAQLPTSAPTTTIQANTTLLSASFVDPVLALRIDRTIPNVSQFQLSGFLTNVVIDSTLAAFYGVPEIGSGTVYELVMDLPASFDTNIGEFSATPTVNSVSFTPVPVPAALPLLLTALAGLGLIGRRKMKAAA